MDSACRRPQPLTSQHFYIGAKVLLKGYLFELTGSDEFTLKFMEDHAFDYPLANVSLILSKIRTAVAPIYKEFFTKYLGSDISTFSQNAFVCVSTTRSALIELLDGNITEHEIVTFIRHFSIKNTNDVARSSTRNAIRSLVQMDLARSLWDDLADMKVLIYHLFKEEEGGSLTETQLRTVMSACKLPISPDLIGPMINV